MYDDAWHRPHADHKGEFPTVTTTVGPESLKVTLNSWGPNDGKLLSTIYNQAQSNWGESPSYLNNDKELTPSQLNVVEQILAGKHLQNALEVISFAFTVEGCTRACTHEMVRSRVGASFAQHGGRDNDWRHRGWTMPETVDRMIKVQQDALHPELVSCGNGQTFTNFMRHYLEEAGLILTHDFESQLLERWSDGGRMHAYLMLTLTMQKCAYAAMVDAGVPWQDARRILGIGHQTYIHANYNFVALRGVLAHRLEHMAVDWEIDCVAQLMMREIWLHCPRIIARALGSHSDKAGVNKFANLYSWPPNGKWPNPKDHDENRKNTFNRLQGPFFVLDPRCLVQADRPVSWIKTNGIFPHKEYNTLALEVQEELNRRY
jgi:thymidylate synthase ThyX